MATSLLLVAAALPLVGVLSDAVPAAAVTAPPRPTIAGGNKHSLMLKGDGTVWATGSGYSGELGNGTTTSSRVPVQVNGLNGVTAVAAGWQHSMALKGDGTVWGWGYNLHGQVGNGTTTNSLVPVPVSGLSGVTAISVGSDFSVAVKGDGTVWAWGYNDFRQLGNGTTTNSSVPVRVNGLSGVTAVTSGLFHSLALKGDGTVWAWGTNYRGSFGNGTTDSIPGPVQVSGLSGVTAVSAGGTHSLAVKSDGTVWAWGDNALGQLGNGTTANSSLPVRVSSLSGVNDVSGGFDHSLAVKGDGTAWAWGDNPKGQLGNGTTTNSSVPVQVVGLSGVTAVAARSVHSLAVKGDGTVWAWGYNDSGQLGDGTTTQRHIPVWMSGLVQPTLTGGPLAGPETFGGGNGFNKYCGDCTTHNQAGDPVDTATGNFWETFTDVAVPGRGVPMSVSRTYNSQAAGTDGLFGFGWSWTYGTNLRVTSRESGTLRPLGVTVHQGNGATATFSRPSSSSAFSAPPRVDGSVVHDPSTDTYTVKRGPRETLTFDGGGRLTGVRDPNGYLTTLAWSATQLVVTEPAPGLRQLRFTLAADASGRSRVTQVVDPAGRVVSYRYDTSGNLTDVFDVTGPVPPPAGPYTAALGHTVLGYANPANHLMTTRRSPRFANDTTTVPAPVLKNVYDGSIPPRVVEQTSELGYKTTFSYGGDPAYPGSVIVTRPDNNNAPGANKTLDQYLDGVLVTHIKGYGSPTASTWRYVHDPATLGVTRTEAPNGVSLARYDSRGSRVWATDPLGRTTEAGFNAFDQPLWVKDAKGTVTTYTYDQSNTGPNLVSTATPLNATQTATTTLFYGERGNTNRGEVTSMVDPEHQPATATSPRWQYAYDPYGLRTSVTDPLGHTASQMFDVVGRRTRSTNGLGKTTLYEFDPDGSVTKVTDPVGRVSVRHYDADRNPDYSIDGKGNRTDVTYDAAGQRRQVTRPAAAPGEAPTLLFNEYWGDGSLREQRDGAGAPTGYAYDAQGRLVTETDPAGRVTRYGYDPAGNQTSKANPGGSCTVPVSGCTTMGYDNANQLKTVAYSDKPADNTGYDYDPNGRRTVMTDGSGSSAWAYDLAGRLLSHTDGASQTVAYKWDRKSQLTEITYPGQTVPVRRDFDDAGRLYRITDWLGNPSTFGYDDNSNIETQTSPASSGSVVDTFSRNDADELTTIRIDKGPASLATFSYGRDSNGQVASVASTGLADSHSYTYTGLNQLKNLDAGAYGYDAADNLVRTPTGGQQSFDSANQLCWTNPTINPAGSCTTNIPATASRYGYDNRGNRVSRSTPGAPATSYGYDQANRLVTATPTTPSGSVSGGFYHSLAVKADGTAWSWGWGLYGQLGNGGYGTSTVPVRVSGLTGVVAVAGGGQHSLALKADGTVWAWGSNMSGQLGTNNTANSAIPARTQGLTGVVAIAAGPAHSLALKADGTVWAWGANWYGEVGNPAFPGSTSVPVQVQGLSGVTAVSAGWGSSQALKGDGTVWSWGYNGYGELGNNTTTNSPVPVVVQGLNGVSAIAAGYYHRLAAKADGTVWAWGRNDYGQLGNNTTVWASLPIQASGLSGVTAVAANGYHSLAVRGDGTVAAWGDNSDGQLGNGTTIEAHVPQTVPALVGSTAIAVGPYNTLAVKADGSAISSGYNGDGTVGDGTTTTPRLTPVAVTGYNRGFAPQAAYAYDGDSLRTSKTVAGTTTRFTWDQAQGLPLLLDDGTNRYIYGPDGKPLQHINRDNTVTWYHHDQIGSTRLLTNSSGAATATYTYDPYGNLTNQTGTTTTPLQYAGEYSDGETGFQYLRARYYDPTTAQFLTRDPLVSVTRSAYGYVEGNPLNGTDPSGLMICLVVCIASPLDANPFRHQPLVQPLAEPRNKDIVDSWERPTRGPLIQDIGRRTLGAAIYLFPPPRDKTCDDVAGRRPTVATRKAADDAARDADGAVRCQYCGDEVVDGAGSPLSREYDHVTPHSQGGGREIDNIDVACRTCNRQKGGRTLAEWGGP